MACNSRGILCCAQRVTFTQIWTGSTQCVTIPYVFYAAAFAVSACGIGGEGMRSDMLVVHPQSSYPRVSLPAGLRLSSIPVVQPQVLQALMKHRDGATPPVPE
jgi:hypothetical protein